MGRAPSKADLFAALQNVKEAGANDMLSVPAPRITVHQVHTVKNALLHPREKPDWTGFAGSFTSACILVVKTLVDIANAPKPSTLNLALFAAGIALAAATLHKFVAQLRKKHPFHDQALTYVEALIVEKAADAAKQPLPALPESLQPDDANAA